MKEQIGEQTKLASLGLLSDTAFKGTENWYDRGQNQTPTNVLLYYVSDGGPSVSIHSFWSSFSGPAFSSTVKWCFNFLVLHCKVLRFPVLQFPVLHWQSTLAFFQLQRQRLPRSKTMHDAGTIRGWTTSVSLVIQPIQTHRWRSLYLVSGTKRGVNRL